MSQLDLEAYIKKDLNRREFLVLLASGLGLAACTPTAEPAPTATTKPAAALPPKVTTFTPGVPAPIPGPDFSNSTAKAVFVNKFGTGDSAFIAKPDGSDSQPLAINIQKPLSLRVYGALWSPTYNRFIHDHQIFGNDGQLQQTISRLTVDKATVSLRTRSWSPDGNSLIYAGYSFDSKAARNLYEYSLNDGSHRKILATQPDVADNGPVVSPDGQKLAFLHHEWGVRGYVTVTDLDPGKYPIQGEDRYKGKLNPDIRVMEEIQNIHQDFPLPLYWSPDNRKLVYLVPGSVHIADVVTGDIRRIPFNSDFESSISISPANDRFAVGEGYNPAMFHIFSFDGDLDQKIKFFPTLSGNGDISNVNWSADRSSLMFIHGDHEIKSANLSNGRVTTLPGRLPQSYAPVSFSPFSL